MGSPVSHGPPFFQLEIDVHYLFAVEEAQSLPSAGHFLSVGLQLVLDVRAESGEMIMAAGVRDEGFDLQRLRIFQLHHSLFYGLSRGGSDRALDLTEISVLGCLLAL